ncbi:MAG: PAS domain S-box protein [Halapricum sp.]
MYSVLVVGSEIELLNCLGESHDRFGVVSVRTANEAVARLSDGEQFDCVVGVHDPPDSDGLAVLDEVRDVDGSIPFILVTAPDTGVDGDDALARGASEIMRYRPEADQTTLLETRIRRVIESGPSTRERDLRQSEERYRNLVENSPAPINLFDDDGNAVWGNDAVLDLLGLDDLEALRGRSIFEFIHPDDHETARDELEMVIEEGESVGPTTFRIVRADDEVRHVQIKTTVGWFQGELVGQAVVVDITDLREAEERLRQNEQRYRTLVEMSPDPIIVHVDSEIVYANDAMVDLVEGESRDALAGTSITRYLSIEETDVTETARQVQRGENAVTRYERTVRTLTGATRHIETTSRPIAYEGEPAVLTIVKDVTDRYRHEEMLTTLHDRTRAMTRADGRREIADVAVETATELLEMDESIFYEFDGDDTLVPLSWSPYGGESVDLPSIGSDDPIWEAFVEDELQVLDRPSGDRLSPGQDFETLLALPVGNHGVLVAGSTAEETPGQMPRQVAGLIMENLDAALDRAARDTTLLERDRQLQQQNETLEQLNRLNEIIREINQTLVRSTSRAEIEANVCEQFATTERYAFAWLDDRDAPEEATSSRRSSGVSSEFLDHLAVAESASPLRALVETAARTRSVEVVRDLLNAPDWQPHRSDALRYGYRAVAAIPVVRGGTIDSVLVVHAEDGDIFDERERAVLAELGETIGYALRNVERVDAILTDDRTEIDLTIADDSLFTNRLANDLGARVEFEGAVPDENGELRVFFRFSNLPSQSIESDLASLETVRSVQTLAVGDDTALCQVRLDVPPLVEILRGFDARIRSLSAEDGTTNLTVVVTGDGTVRSLVEQLRRTYPETELRARREHADPIDTEETFRDRLLETLTEKQLDALRTAHYGGFYEWPRESTSEALAETRGIASSTFQYHLRAAERKLVASVLDSW